MTEAELDMCLERMHFGFRRLIEGPDKLLAAQGLGRAHHRALFFIRRAERLPVGELGKILDVTVQALHRVTSDLLREGMVQSTMDTADRRVRILSLTKKGVRFEARISGAQRDMFAAIRAIVGAEAMAGWSQVMAEMAAERPVRGRS